MGRPLENFDSVAFSSKAAELVERSQGMNIQELDAGSMVMELMRISGDHDLCLPPELSMLGKALLNLDQILVEGFFHADPHPGNVLLTDDNRVALIDLGMVARVPAPMRKLLASCCWP